MGNVELARHCKANTILKYSGKTVQLMPRPGLNQGPLDLQSNALPTELSRQVTSGNIQIRKFMFYFKMLFAFLKIAEFLFVHMILKAAQGIVSFKLHSSKKLGILFLLKN